MQDALLHFMQREGTPESRISPFHYPLEEMTSPQEGRQQHLADATCLLVMCDEQGQLIGFPTIEDAQWCLAPDLSEWELEERTFGWLRQSNPKNLVYIQGQYYWAQDLG
jgi:hypothetical protein